MKEYKETKITKKQFVKFAICLIIAAVVILTGAILAFAFLSGVVKWVIFIIGLIVGILAGGVGGLSIILSFSMTGIDQSVKDGNSAKGIANAILCDACGRVIKNDAVFCEHCGKKQENDVIKTCPYCGAELNGTASFCDECGKEVE